MGESPQWVRERHTMQMEVKWEVLFREREWGKKGGRGGKRLTLGIGAAEKKRKREEEEVEVGGVSPFKGTGYCLLRTHVVMTYAM